MVPHVTPPKHAVHPRAGAALLAAALGLGCRSDPVPPTPHATALASATVTAPSQPAAICGDGRVDAPESCDYGIPQGRGCPDGWGVCRTCASNCTWAIVPRDRNVWPGDSADLQELRSAESHDIASEMRRYHLEGKLELTFVERRTFDDAGRLLSATRDLDGDGDDDLRLQFEYDDHGLRTKRWAAPNVTDTSGRPASPDATTQRWSFRYDASG